MMTDKLKDYKPRVGSRPHQLAQMRPGERTFFEAPTGRLAPMMSQIGVDIRRAGIKANQRHVIGIQPDTRELIDLIMVTVEFPSE